MNLSYQFKGDVWFLIEKTEESHVIGCCFLKRIYRQVEAIKKNVDVSSFVSELSNYMKRAEFGIRKSKILIYQVIPLKNV